ncbi:MFS transporter [Neorhizobium alkalisoli]|uniref:Sugar transport protein n=1 Tax=Neorhizobium alkalisoli TaxID=528178 RepID=A0A561QBE0_9HYPH|nr:MFS transporter [Neorhizobium alkalisoli]TWF47657.1 sugar transport protein [Neorhizobium alkalisoli]
MTMTTGPMPAPDILSVSPSTPKQSRYLHMITGVATLGALAFGYDTGVIAGALPFMTQGPEEGGLGLTPVTEGVVTASLIVGAALGSFAGGQLSDRYGRRTAMLLLAIVFFLGALATAFSPDVGIMIVVSFSVLALVALRPSYRSSLQKSRRRNAARGLSPVAS